MDQTFVDSSNLQTITQQLRAYFVPWEELRRKQGALTASQLAAVNSGVTAGYVALIVQNAADIESLRGTIATHLRARKVTALPSTGEANVIYIVPDAGQDPTDPDQCTEYMWFDSRYEIVGKTSVTPGDGTLTINVNGQSAGTFSADQSSDTTISLTIPLAVSDLQNDLEFQTSAEVAAAVSYGVSGLRGDLADVAFSGSYDDLTDKPSYPGIGDGTLTIAQNGTQVGSFTANQDSASTINIITPTKTSDLQNDSDFVDASDLATKQAQLTQAQLDAVNSGITDTSVAQIEVNRVAIQGKQTQLTQTQLNAVNSGITSGKVALFDAHLADTDAHVTAAQKAAWTAKQDALTEAQLAAVNSGVTAQKVTSYDDHVADADIHVTAAQKAAWTAKQDALTAPQLNAVNSGITSALVTQIGTNQTDISGKVSKSGDTMTGALTPSTNGGAPLGSSSLQWSAVYAQTYYYNGTAWGLDKSNTWTGSNNFTSNFVLQNTSWSGVTPPTSTKVTIVEFKNSDTRQGRYINRIGVNSAETWIETIRNVNANTSHNFTVIFSVDNAGNKKLFPYNSDAELGELISGSTGRWKTLNGVNPGALGMPNLNSYVDIDTTDWNLTGVANRVYINGADPTYPGWLYVRISNATSADALVVRLGTSAGSSPSFNGTPVDSHISLYLACPADTAIRVYAKVSAIAYCRFYPCLGNV